MIRHKTPAIPCLSFSIKDRNAKKNIKLASTNLKCCSIHERQQTAQWGPGFVRLVCPQPVRSGGDPQGCKQVVHKG